MYWQMLFDREIFVLLFVNANDFKHLEQIFKTMDNKLN